MMFVEEDDLPPTDNPQDDYAKYKYPPLRLVK